MRIYLLTFHLALLCLLCNLLSAQPYNCNPLKLDSFFELYGGKNAFSQHSIDAINAFLGTEAAIYNEDYQQAQNILDALFAKYPQGSNVWHQVSGSVNGANLGSPNCYFILRMMEDIVAYNLNKTNYQKYKTETLTLGVLIVGCAEATVPQTQEEMDNGTGLYERKGFNSKIKENDYCMIRQSFDLYGKYLNAITHGELKFEIEIIEIPSLCLSVSINNTHATPDGYQAVTFLDENQRNKIDWFWVLYPSIEPTSEAFEGRSFISGGVGRTERGGPYIVGPDKSITFKAAGLGTGDYTDLERRIYIPQWFQHESFHYFFGLYPEFKLEETSHSYFDRGTWPSDFVGKFEPDYYYESVHKRFQTKKCNERLAVKTLTKVTDDFYEKSRMLSQKDLVGSYVKDNASNNWEIGDIIDDGGKLIWKNKAGVQWQLSPNFENGILYTGDDSPYQGQHFKINMIQSKFDSENYPEVDGFTFLGGVFRKQNNVSDKIRNTLPISSTVGYYEKTKSETILDHGNIFKQNGIYFWQNNRGIWHDLKPNTENENFELGANSSSPNEKFNLVITDSFCDEYYVLGFEHLGEYFWKQKKDIDNQSPIIQESLPDLNMSKDFGYNYISLTNKFNDPEGDQMLLFATVRGSKNISANIQGENLIIQGNGNEGNSNIIVIAIDPNGGRIAQEFSVNVKTTVAVTNYYTNELFIYPNPTEDKVIIQGDLNVGYLSIISTEGRLVKNINFKTNEVIVDMQDISNGVYFFHIFSEKGEQIATEKVIKY